MVTSKDTDTVTDKEAWLDHLYFCLDYGAEDCRTVEMDQQQLINLVKGFLSQLKDKDKRIAELEEKASKLATHCEHLSCEDIHS